MKYLDENGLRWHKLCQVSLGDKPVEVMAATCEDGIGIIVSWKLQRDGAWKVDEINTEDGKWTEVTEFGDGEVIPPKPPDVWDDISAERFSRKKCMKGAL